MTDEKMERSEPRLEPTTNRRGVLKAAGIASLVGGLGLGTGVAGGRPVMGGPINGVGGPVASTEDPGPGVDPDSVSVQLAPGESVQVTKEVVTPEIPPMLDVFLLEDETGSFGDDIANLKALAPAIWESIADSGTDFTFGVGGFRDYARGFWGGPNDWVYDLNQDLTTDKTAFVDGVNALTAGGGGDGPEGYLEALHYIADASHGPIDSNGDGDTTDDIDTPAGDAPSWREGATRVVLLTTDNTGHVEGDAGGWPGHEGPLDLSLANTIAALNAAEITVIGLTPSSISTVNALTSGTGGSVQSTSTSGDEIGDAILDGLSALPAEVTPSVGPCDDGLTVSFDAVSKTVTSGDTATFTETIAVDSDVELEGNEDTLNCTVDFLVNGESAGDAFVQSITVEVCADVVVDLVAGQNEVIGTVTVSEDGDDISVTYSLHDDWYMTESHLHLATDCDDIPQTGSGNPKPGRFDYSRNYDPAVQEDTYVIDQSAAGFVDNDELCIAAHAAVFEDADGDGVFDDGERGETAWGEGDPFTERGNWAMHFEYEVCD